MRWTPKPIKGTFQEFCGPFSDLKNTLTGTIMNRPKFGVRVFVDNARTNEFQTLQSNIFAETKMFAELFKPVQELSFK